MTAELRARRLSDTGASSSSGPLLLVVDDDASIREFLTDYAGFCGFRVESCRDGREALDLLDRQSADVALVDLRMPQIDGLEVIRLMRQKDPHCQVVLMSGVGTIGAAVEAIKLGARDYLEKPFEPAVLEALLHDIKSTIDSRKQAVALQHPLVPAFEFCGMLGRSAVMQELFDLVRRLAPHVKALFITGESGTGKEMVARAVHQLGPRFAGEFVAIGCAGLAESHGESELFGHVHGAFPGATEDRPGAFERADGGVLFFDEVSELPLALQGRLLRVLEHGEITRLGSHQSRTINAVVIACTRHDLRTEMLAGRFRQDLYYRLSTASLRVPPLRERKEDIPYLASAFIAESSTQLGRRIVGLTAEAETLLQQGDWRGNVRQLRNTIERACMLAEADLITERQLAQVFQLSRPVAPARL
jgi:DNA-binding NtrC family response regulator